MIYGDGGSVDDGTVDRGCCRGVINERVRHVGADDWLGVRETFLHAHFAASQGRR